MRFRTGARYARMRLAMVVTVCAVAACAPVPEPVSYTVGYFRENAQEREVALRECGENPGQLAATPNCVNAKEAERLEGVGSLRELPPLGLPTERDK